ncbi:CDP-glycerol glycerophosphotransferase family protein [Arcobacter lanthieri]|uniref:CDP-glycerol glycerophosphotransferase family protein n=1 Tax=Aliarcobacter lanthieri TaxID=1355374 RepID=UPI0019205FE1|nr:CDP-glycerol glycerophosphotransferase family protein [Aliarcobacter lanthieri]MBL3519176.1 CDP-glycerol glycerophosphotransferase family protein [Aliarcobacter lanthieri]
MNKICVYDIESIKTLFKQNKKVFAYGNGSFYNKVKDLLYEFNLYFDDVLYTENKNIKIQSGRDIDLTDDIFIFICSTYYDEIYKTLLEHNIKRKNIIQIVLECSDSEYSNSYKKEIVHMMRIKHHESLQKLKKKERIKVIFIVYLVGMWKCENIFQKMLQDTKFEPIVFIAPYLSDGRERMLEELHRTKEFFSKKDFSYIIGFNIEKGFYIDMDSISPDIIFFTTPWNYSKGIYYQNLYTKYLTCYIPYAIFTPVLKDYYQFNQIFHNYIWKIFCNNSFEKRIYNEFSARKDCGVYDVGASYLEDLIEKINVKNVWKTNDSRKKVIFAPHHTIDTNKQGWALSNFLFIADDIKKLAIKYKNEIVWAFKPHPHLKNKLYNHINWGKDKTDDYYNFWDKNNYTQLEMGVYNNLFKQSDAMIHDSASFLAEYLILKKPVMYLVSEFTKESLNNFGLKCLNACTSGKNKEEIKTFLISLKNNTLKIKYEHEKFYIEDLRPYYTKNLPSERIIQILKNSILS